MNLKKRRYLLATSRTDQISFALYGLLWLYIIRGSRGGGFGTQSNVVLRRAALESQRRERRVRQRVDDDGAAGHDLTQCLNQAQRLLDPHGMGVGEVGELFPYGLIGGWSFRAYCRCRRRFSLVGAFRDRHVSLHWIPVVQRLQVSTSIDRFNNGRVLG
jgi:hypothetical protein